MGWFWFALLTMLAWGAADLFYKKGADEKDKYSHLKTVIAVGVVMGLHAIITLLTSDVEYNFINLLKYLPVSLMYILSMAVGYFGLRYLELSISSPIQNASGAVACLLCVIFLGDTLELPVIIAILLICGAVIGLGVVEKRESDLLEQQGDKKYKIGFVAFFMPIIYCVIDALGTFLDAFYLDDPTSTPLVGATEDNIEIIANASYELTFLICAIVAFVFLIVTYSKNDIARKQAEGAQGNKLAIRLGSAFKQFFVKVKPSRLIAAVFETAGQFTYVYAMSGQGAIAAPMIAAYSIVSMILSRIFLKEKLTWLKYLLIGVVMVGIAILGVYDA